MARRPRDIRIVRGSGFAAVTVLASALCVLLLASPAITGANPLHNTESEGDRSSDTTSTSASPVPVWDEHVELERCNTGTFKEIGYGDPAHPPVFGMVTFVDLATFENVTLDVRDVCRQRVPLSPDPFGDMCATFAIRDAKVEVAYFEAERSISGSSEFLKCVVRIGRVEAELRLAVQKRARPNATAEDKAGMSRREVCQKFDQRYSVYEVRTTDDPTEPVTDDKKVKAIGRRARLLAQLTDLRALKRDLRELARSAIERKWRSLDGWERSEAVASITDRCAAGDSD